jgi:ribosomal-protein-alanine N-acetyltransferase
MISEILRIQAEGFKNGSPEKFVKYSKNYKNIFHVIKSQDKVIGYCTYYLKLILSFKGFVKQLVISEISIDRNFIGNGFAEGLLNENTGEMKLDAILSIISCVNIKTGLPYSYTKNRFSGS